MIFMKKYNERMRDLEMFRSWANDTAIMWILEPIGEDYDPLIDNVYPHEVVFIMYECLKNLNGMRLRAMVKDPDIDQEYKIINARIWSYNELCNTPIRSICDNVNFLMGSMQDQIIERPMQ